MTAPNEDLIALQNKIADLTESLATTQGLVTKINSVVSSISSTLTATQAIATGLTEQTITPYSANSLGPLIAALGYATPTSQTYIAANRAYYYPFRLAEAVTCYKAFWVNGAAVSGNVDIGIYTSAGVKVASTGSTAQAGTSVTQIATLSASLAAGNYYLAFACDNTTATFHVSDLAATAIWARIFNIQYQAAAFALPSTATFAAAANANQPMYVCGLAFRSDFA